MARRGFVEEPTSRLAVWARRLGVFSLPVALLAVIIERSGLLDILPALATFVAALALAVAAILLAIAAFVVIWRTGVNGFGYALTGFLLGVALLAYPSFLGIKAYRLPTIADITTDPIDPPRFEAIVRLRTREANPVAYPGLYVAELQRAAYPDIEPLVLNVAPQVAYEAVMTVVTKRRWRVVDARAPQGGRREGHVEAVARTPIMGFRDDVVIRVRGVGAGSRVDLRSASRYGRHDLGTNAARIRSLAEDIEEVATAEKPERQPRQVQKASQPPKGGQPARR
jgi:uncharacterized protein (DUF1499 family)